MAKTGGNRPCRWESNVVGDFDSGDEAVTEGSQVAKGIPGVDL